MSPARRSVRQASATIHHCSEEINTTHVDKEQRYKAQVLLHGSYEWHGLDRAKPWSHMFMQFSLHGFHHRFSSSYMPQIKTATISSVVLNVGGTISQPARKYLIHWPYMNKKTNAHCLQFNASLRSPSYGILQWVKMMDGAKPGQKSPS